MKTISTTNAPAAEAPTMHVTIAGIAELYAAACAFEPISTGPIDSLGDMDRACVMTSVGNIRRLQEALAKVRGAS